MTPQHNTSETTRDRSGLSRRGFLQAAAIGTLGATGAMMAGCAPSTPSAKQLANTGGESEPLVLNSETALSKWEFEIAPDPIDESEITETITKDVVVVGAGPAGTFFAAAYGELGGDAVVVTKSGTAEGRGGTIFAVNSTFMRDQGLSIDADLVLKHEMALWAGAAWQRNAAVPMINHNLGICNQVDGPFPGLVINKLGKRFGNEDSNTVFQGIAQLRQPEGMNYGLFNAAMAENLVWWNYGVDRNIPPQTPEEVLAWWDGWCEQEKVSTYAGAPEVLCYKADTIEELCEQFDLPIETVLETVERYNGFAKNGYDEDYRKNPDLLFSLEEGPYYMFGSGAWNLVMCGGIRSNYHMQALNEDDQVVPGLYVLGMLVGDMYMSPYDFVCGGANLGSTCLTFGYLLAKELSDGTLEG